MEYFRNWVMNLIYIIAFVTLLDLIVPNRKMAKYVKVVSGFLVMLVIVQPLLTLFKENIYLDNLLLKNSVLIEDSLSESNLSNISDIQNKMTTEVYKEKLKEKIVFQIEELINMDSQVLIEIIEDTNDAKFGMITKIDIVLLEKNDNSIEIIEEIVISLDNENKDLQEVDNKTKNKIKKFFLDFYNLSEENITISKQKKN